VIEDVAPSLVVVQGDTTTTFGAAIAAAYAGVPLVHLEAGLRSHDRGQPFPEEIHRSVVTRLAALHIAPTTNAEENLVREGVSPSDIVVTGNTGQDALRIALERLPADEGGADGVIVATLHRRESEAYVEHIAEGLRRAAALPGVSIKVLRHPNPFVSGRFVTALGTDTGIEVIAPLPFTEMIRTLRGCRAVLTDSGGLQEEAAALGIPALVVRDKTCRPEGVESGSAVLVGRSADAVFSAIERLVSDESHRTAMAVPRSIYGDGYAAARAVDRIVTRFGLTRSGQ
jgi:UDP-N-acetylglucosamine 2-epimerase (non-hydrolysing)